MQLMPDVVSDYGVENPFSAAESIAAGARHLRFLHAHFDGDLDLVAAGYNAGIGAVTEHGGIPPYPETQLYVAKVHALHARYRAALGQSAREQPLWKSWKIANINPDQTTLRITLHAAHPLCPTQPLAAACWFRG